MKNKLLSIAAISATMACAGTTHAALPTAFAKFSRASVTSGMHHSIPPTCVQPTINAINSWSAVGANFVLFPDFITSTPRPEEQTQTFNSANVTIDDGVLANPLALMAARVDTNNTTKIIANSDIRIDKRRIWNNDPTQIQLSCSPASSTPPTVVDWESAILHEFGHVVGINHDAFDLACAMYDELGPGVTVRALCAKEKQTYIDNYKTLQIVSLPNVAGPHNVDISAKVFYEGSPTFPLKRETLNTSCPSGWSCSAYNGNYSSHAASPLTFNYKCTVSASKPTATFGWRTTLIDANGVRTNSIDHTSTCTQSTSTLSEDASATPGGINRVIITD